MKYLLPAINIIHKSIFIPLTLHYSHFVSLGVLYSSKCAARNVGPLPDDGEFSASSTALLVELMLIIQAQMCNMRIDSIILEC